MNRVRLASRSTRRSGKPAGIAGKIFGSLFLSVFAVFGAFFLVMIGGALLQTARTCFWTKVECRILSSTVEERSNGGANPYAFAVKYEFEREGRTWTSDQWALQPKNFSNYSDAGKLAARHVPGTRSFCFVNPTNLRESILERDGFGFALFLPIPLLFVAVGLGGIYFIWKMKTERPDEARPISNRAPTARGWAVMLGFSFVFFLAGCLAFYAVTLRPLLRVQSARSWPSVPCAILHSRVQSHRGESATYSIDILYAYSFQGRDWKSSRYGFASGSSSGREGKERIVAVFPAGTQSTCFVNPDNPSEAVLNRGVITEMWIGLITLVFVGFGLGGMIYSWRKRRVAPLDSPDSRLLHEPHFSTHRQGAAPGSNDPLVLKATQSRLMQLVASFLFAAFWNGVVSVFVWQALKGFQRGKPDWFLTIFLIPFVAIGLGALGFVGYSFLRLFNPGVTLRLSRPAIPLGKSADLEWELDGRTRRIRDLRMWLEGREEATYRRGTRTSTDKATFAEIEIASADTPVDIHAGRARITVPANTMHTFQSDNNKILWVLRVHGEIERFPDVSEEFPITVLPVATELARLPEKLGKLPPTEISL